MQIPRKLAQLFPNVDLVIEHAYGREFPSAALREGRYRLVVHCGGCMIDPQKVGVWLCGCMYDVHTMERRRVSLHLTSRITDVCLSAACVPPSYIANSHTHVFFFF